MQNLYRIFHESEKKQFEKKGNLPAWRIFEKEEDGFQPTVPESSIKVE